MTLPTIDKLREMGTPEFFGLGFIQLKVDKVHRYHFYHKSLEPIVPEEEIHDHRYDFTSYVLNGTFIQHMYIFEPDILGDHEMREVDCQTPGQEVLAKTLGFVQHINTSIFIPGTSYWLNKDALHKVEAKDNVITLLKRSETVKTRAKVISPIGTETVCPFSAPLGPERCWELIEDMLKDTE